MEVAVLIVLIIISLVGIFSPETAWYLQEGWMYKDLEPSDAALIAIRIGGVIVLIISIGIIWILFFL